jgi:hypothetical protein
LVGKFEYNINEDLFDIVHIIVKKFLNNTQVRVKYSLQEFHRAHYGLFNHYLKRSCVLHETDSYALVIEIEYKVETDISSINASDLDQPPYDQMKKLSFCIKSL